MIILSKILYIVFFVFLLQKNKENKWLKEEIVLLFEQKNKTNNQFKILSLLLNIIFIGILFAILPFAYKNVSLNVSQFFITQLVIFCFSWSLLLWFLPLAKKKSLYKLKVIKIIYQNMAGILGFQFCSIAMLICDYWWIRTIIWAVFCLHLFIISFVRPFDFVATPYSSPNDKFLTVFIFYWRKIFFIASLWWGIVLWFHEFNLIITTACLMLGVIVFNYVSQYVWRGRWERLISFGWEKLLPISIILYGLCLWIH